MLMPMKIEDGQVLYDYMKVLIPNLSHKFSDLTRYIFAGYEAKGWHYLFETDFSDQPLEENAVGVYTFESIASTLYRYLSPYIDSNGEFKIAGSKVEIVNANGESKNIGTGKNSNNNMSENSPINNTIGEIITPTYKGVNASENSNEFNRNYSDNVKRETYSPEYIKEFVEIREFYLDIMKREVERYVYECRVIY